MCACVVKKKSTLSKCAVAKVLFDRLFMVSMQSNDPQQNTLSTYSFDCSNILNVHVHSAFCPVHRQLKANCKLPKYTNISIDFTHRDCLFSWYFIVHLISLFCAWCKKKRISMMSLWLSFHLPWFENGEVKIVWLLMLMSHSCHNC